MVKHFLLLFCSLSFTAVAQKPLKLYVDFSRTNKRPVNTPHLIADKYFIIFNSHGVFHSDNPEINSVAGHSWIVWGHENAQTKQSEIQGYGFWPNYNILRSENSDQLTNLKVATTAVMGSVPGTLREDLFGTQYSATVTQIVLTVSKNTYDKSLTVPEKYKETNPDYALIGKDCTTFFIEVGKSIGLDMPERNKLSPKSWRPSDYMSLWVNSFTSHNAITIDNNKGYINASETGEYDVRFGNENEGNSNSCKLENGNKVEQKYRNGEITSQQTNYQNGDSWYRESKPRIPQLPASPFNLPVSEYTFSNGNTILDYDPQKFNPQFVPVNLSSGTDGYLGAINSDGAPDGNGWINHYSADPLTGLENTVSRTGVFINGKFSSYVGVNVGNGMAYGEFINGAPSGQVRVEFTDGKIFNGTFVNGKANGYCTLINPKTNYYLSGNLKDGLADGFCTLRVNGNLYKGNFKGGTPEGDGTSWEGNGNVAEGKFKNGRMITGKMTIPNGNYFVGNFNGEGKVETGKYFDKNGRQLKDKEGEGGAGERWISGNVKLGKEAGDGYEINGVKQ